MQTKEEMEKEMCVWNKAHPRNHTLLNEETEIPERKVAEIRFIRLCDVEYLYGRSPLPRLEKVKDYLRYDVTGKPRVPNIWGMTVTGADAKVHKDCRYNVLNDVEIDGLKTEIHCKEINKNAIVFIDVAYSQKLIATEKDKKVQTEMQTRLQQALRLKTRAGYERK